MLTMLKLGGSLITDKRVSAAFRAEVMARVAAEIARAWDETDDLRLIVGHGSGSFGHIVAERYQTMAGVATPEQWHGFAEVADTAAALNTLVMQALREADLPAMRFAPSASAIAEDGRIVTMTLEPLRHAYGHHLLPVVYGDVGFDRARGGTILSTETVFTYLAQHLPVTRIILVGEVAGVYDAQQTVIPLITPDNLPAIRGLLGESAGVDVTGGMLTKVTDMVALAAQKPGLEVRIIDGSQPDNIYRALRGQYGFGTRITAAAVC